MATMEELESQIGQLTEALNRMVEAQESRAIEASARLGSQDGSGSATDKGESGGAPVQSVGDMAAGNVTSILQSGLNSIKSAIANLGVELARPITEQINDMGKRISDSILAGYRADKTVYQNTSQFVKQLERQGSGLDYSEVQRLYAAHSDMENRAIRGQIKVDKAAGRDTSAWLKTESLKRRMGRADITQKDAMDVMFPVTKILDNFWTSGD